jgi:acetyl esterase/lipase
VLRPKNHIMIRLANWPEEAGRRFRKPAFSAQAVRPPTHFFFAVLMLVVVLAVRGVHMAFAATAAGALISMTALPGAPDGASAYRVLYTSTDLSGDLVPVSGVVIVPRGPVPPGGRPIVAWAHPTTGIVCRCAPSLARAFFASVQGLKAMLAHGYIVAATDYPGLGTPEVHPYLVGISEGRAVLDSVRAAQQIPGADASHVFAVWGHSQGGHAALYAGLLAKQYAPELRLDGVAVAAPATDLVTLMTDDLGTGGGNNITAMTLWSWSRIYNVPISQVLTPEAASTVDRLASECIERWFDIFIRRSPTVALKKSFLRVHDLAAIEPWHQLLVQNTPGALPPGVPVFVAQGSSDRLVQPAVTAAYVHALCRDGSKVEFDLLPGVGHAFIARDSANAAIAWITARFDGKPAPTDCNHLIP